MAPNDLKIAYLILAHNDAKNLAILIKLLLKTNGLVCLHADKSSQLLLDLKEYLGSCYDELIVAKQVKVEWGEWSIVEATLNGIRAIAGCSVKPDYIHLMSGSDFPIKSIKRLKKFLQSNYGTEFIESCDCNRENWVAGGTQTMRYRYRHVFNWKKNKKLFDLFYSFQHHLGLERKIPKGLTPRIGSQWWTLTYETCIKILEYEKKYKFKKFFKYVWIPDELYFQSIILNIVPNEKIAKFSLTLNQFTAIGRPILYYNDHIAYLENQSYFFARKISPYANKLRSALSNSYVNDSDEKWIASKEVCQKTGEYREFCKYYQYGVYGRRRIGFPSDNKYSKNYLVDENDEYIDDLEWNVKRYFVIVGDNSHETKFVQNSINGMDGYVCHGELFNTKNIFYIDQKKHYAGYRDSAIAIRDYHPYTFLFDLINHEERKMTGFILRYGQNDELLERISNDPNSSIIYIENESLESYRQNKGICVCKESCREFSSEANANQIKEIGATRNRLIAANKYYDGSTLIVKIRSKGKIKRIKNFENCVSAFLEDGIVDNKITELDDSEINCSQYKKNDND